MSALIDIANKKANCGGKDANTGKLGCLQDFGTPLSLVLTKKGFSIPKETELNIAYLKTNIQNGNLIPLIEASSFEDASAEDTFSTNAAGVERLNLKGLPKYKFMFEEGHEFYRQMSKLTSYKSRGVILIDHLGNWLVAVNNDGDYTGLTVGQITAELRKVKVQGGDAEMRALSVQFIDREEFDSNYAIFQRSELGYGAEDIPTINGAKVSISAIPSSGDTSISVNVVLASDGSSPVEGLAASDFVIDNAGSSIVPSVATETTAGNYTLTVTALSAGATTADLQVGTFDAVIVGDDLFRSDVSEAVTVA